MTEKEKSLSPNRSLSILLSRESLPVVSEDRVLILGSRLSGSFELAKELQAYLEEKEIPNLEVEILRDAGKIKQAFLGQENSDQGESKATSLPRGVILLPQMRQHDAVGYAMSLDTYGCGIGESVKNLCNKYGIPLVMIKSYSFPKQISEGLNNILLT
jgi:hypothetical protein